MTKKTWTLLIALAGVVIFAAPADAQFVDERRWDVCGGSIFNTCASVHVGIDSGNKVTMQVWNLSGREYLGETTYAGTVFTKIGFYNTDGALLDAGSGLAMSGGIGDPAAMDSWVLGDGNNAGGISLELATSSEDGGNPIDNAIANNCIPDADHRDTQWLNPCSDTGPLPGLADAGWITIEFQLASYAGGDLDNWGMLIMGQTGPDNDESTQCFTVDDGETARTCDDIPTNVVPEPLTMALLGSGLAGLGGINAVRRRRRGDEVEDEAA